MAGIFDALAGLFGGNAAQPQPSQQPQAPQQVQPSQGISGGDFRETLRNIAPAIAMIDPRNQQMGMALMAANQDRRDRQIGQQRANKTAEWLQSQGLSPEEAATYAGDKELLRSFIVDRQNRAKPNWQVSEIYDTQGNPKKVLIDTNNPTNMRDLGGSKQPQMPDGIQSLQWRANAAGLQPGTPEYQKFMAMGGEKVPLVTINGPNSDKFKEKSDEAAAKRLDDIVLTGQSAPQTMADMQQLLDLGSTIGTGKGAQLKAALGPWAQAAGINIEGLSDIQAYEAITSRLAPQMRAVGSGASSDRDVSLFLQSLPNLRNTQGGNEIIANTMKAVAQNKIDAATIARRAQSGEISWQDADKAIAALPNPYETFKGFMGGDKKPSVQPNSGVVDYSDYFKQ